MMRCDTNYIKPIIDAAAANPDKVAIWYKDSAVSYGEMVEQAGTIAQLLYANQLKEGNVVAVCMDVTAVSPVIYLGIWMAGCVVLPLCTEDPPKRHLAKLKDSDAKIVFVEQKYQELFADAKVDTICMSCRFDDFEIYRSNINKEIERNLYQYSYIIFTSGSTGEPKGILNTNDNLFDHFVSYAKMCGMSEDDICLGCSPLHFDCVFEEIIAPLVIGGTIVIPENDLKTDADYLEKLIIEKKVTILSAPAPILRGLNESLHAGNKFRDLKTIVTGGDVLRYRDIDMLLDIAQIYNGYGLSEATISSLWHKVSKLDKDNIPIGKPICGKKVYILDDNLIPVKQGQVGNIYLGGSGVAVGYLNDMIMTNEKFVDDPFCENNQKMVDTGDIGRALEDGSILFLGRKDHQISMNGIRMELPEIENAIMMYKTVKDCCLVPVKTEETDHLCAYIVVDEECHKDFSITELVKIFKEYLPVHMLPQKFFQVARIPRTEVGKIDLKELEYMECKLCRKAVEDDEYYSDTQKRIKDIWVQVLKIEPEFVSLKSNIYELGADSLLTLQIFQKIRQAFDLQITMDKFKHKDTIVLQAEVVDSDIEDGKALGFTIPKVHKNYYHLTSAQKRMWIMSKLENNTAIYNTLSVNRFVGALDIQRFRHSLNMIMKTEPILRASFFEKDKVIYQKAAAYSEFPMMYIEIPKGEEEAAFIEDYIEKEKNYKFDFENELLLRGYLFKCSENNHVFLLNISHIITDNVSWKIFLKKLAKYYDGNDAPYLENTNYFDYAECEVQYLESDNVKQQLAYWVEKLKDSDTLLLDLQPYRKRPTVLESSGSSKRITLEKKVLDTIKVISQKEKISVYAFLLACFKILAFIYSGQEDIIIGTPVVNRNINKTEDMLGLFLNVICIRNKIESNVSVIDFMKKVHMTVQEAMYHQEVPFENVVQSINPERRLNQSPVFQILFDYHGNDTNIFNLDGIKVVDIPIKSNWAKNEISITAIEASGELIIDFEYNSMLYSKAFIEEILKRYKQMICNVAKEPEQLIFHCRFMTEEDKLLIERFNQQSIAYNKENKLLHEIFQDQVAMTPDKVALILEEKTISYNDLNVKANKMARALLQYGVKSSDIVALLFNKSFDLYILIIALIKIGAAYMPIEPAHPIEHINNIINTAKPKFIISDQKKDLYAELSEIDFSDLNKKAESESGENLQSYSSADSILNIIFTSASTGKPKGVMTSVKAVLNRLEWEWSQFPFKETDIMSHHKSYTLIGSVWEMFGGLLKGIPTVIIPRERVMSGMLLTDIDRYHISHLFASPPILNLLLKEKENSNLACENFRFAVCSAEPISWDFVNKWENRFRNVKLINFYGSTEDCSDVAFFDTEELNTGNSIVPAGKPISYSEIYVLDQFDNILPAHVAGRVCVSGLPLSEGYINQEELTRKVFRKINIDGKYEKNVYITGDWGYITSEKNLVILGRYDHLVKVRGYLIELSDVELEISSIPGVKQVGVIMTADGDEHNIAAYVSLHSGQRVSKEVIYKRLKSRLPEYMIPAYITIVPKLPVTPNGKIDRLKLSEISRDVGASTYFGPRTPMERIIQEIWENILKSPHISIYDDFFMIGGDSLKAIQLIGHIRHIFGINYPLMEFFSKANIVAMSSYISAQKGVKNTFDIEKNEKREEYPLAYVQEGFWFYNKLEPLNIFYNIAANRIQGPFDLGLFQKALAKTIQRHDALRMVFGEKGGIPYITVKDKMELEIPVIDLSDFAEKESEMLKLSREEINTPFDLENGPLIRCKYFRYGENDGVILINMHHIVTDGWSINVLLGDISGYYNAYLNHEEPVLNELPISYSDFILWQRNKTFESLVEKQKEYWKEKLSGKLPVLGLMGKKKRPELVTYNGEIIQFEISEEKTLQLKQLGYHYNSTLFMVLLSLYYITLYRYTKDEDIIIGSPIAGRGYPQIENVIGCFINTLCIRSDCNGKMCFKDIITEVRKNVIDAFSNSNLSFDELVNMLNPKRDVSRSPIFQSMMTMQDKPSNLFELSGNQISDAGVINDLAPYDLSVIVWVEDNKTTFYVEYYSDVFTKDFMEKFFADYRLIMESVLECADKPIEMIPLLDNNQISAILKEWNAENSLKFDTDVGSKIKECLPDETYTVYLLDDLLCPVTEGMIGSIYLIRNTEIEIYLQGKKDVLIPTGIQAYYYEDNILHTKNTIVENVQSISSVQEGSVDETISAVKSIWETILQKEVTDIDADFFSLGGSSLLLIQVLELLVDAFDVELTVMDLFKYTSIKQLSVFLSSSKNEITLAEDAMTSSSKRRNVRRKIRGN